MSNLKHPLLFSYIYQSIGQSKKLIFNTKNNHFFQMDDNKYRVRRLELEDYDKGYMNCLNQLTISVDSTKDEFTTRYNLMKSKGDYHIFVIVDLNNNRIVASGTLFVEYKILRGCAKKGHIEDIVVDKDTRGSGLGKKIVTRLIKLSEELGCYKTALVCEKDNIPFYEKCGLTEKEREMVIYNKK